MAVSFRCCSTRLVPSIQVISNLNRKQRLFVHSSLHEHKFSIASLSSRSVFLNHFLSKRNVGSLSVGVVELNQMTEDRNLPEHLTVANFNNCHQDVFRFHLRPFQHSPTTHDIITYKHQEVALANLNFSFNGYTHALLIGAPQDPVVSEFEKKMILLSESSKSTNLEPPNTESGRPTPDQLLHVLNVLSETLPKLFVQPLDYSIYHPNLVFENNVRGTRTVGIYHYVKQIALLRIIGHLKFAFVKFDILKITSHPEDGSVKVRWRIRGISGLRVFYNFWKFRLFDMKKSIEEHEELWYDGFSTFYVGPDGKVFKIVVDKMQPDPEGKTDNLKPTLAAKLALMLGLRPEDYAALSQVVDTINESSRCLAEVMLPLDKIE